MTIDISNITQMTTPQIVDLCHKATATPSVIIVAALAPLIFLIVGMANTSTKDSRRKVLIITLQSFIFIGIVAIATIFLPNVIQNISDFFVKTFT